MKRFSRLLAFILVDICMINAAFLLAFWLRFDGEIPAIFFRSYQGLAPLFTVFLITCFFVFKLYNRMWQYASTGEMVSILVAVSTGMLLNVAYAYIQMQMNVFPVPRTVFAFFWILTVVLVGGWRFLLRLLRRQRLLFTRGNSARHVLIVGAGDAGATVARELKNRNSHANLPIGFVDDDPAKEKMRLFGMPVLGRREDIPRLVEEYRVEEIVIAIPSAPGKVIRELVDICEKTPASLKILPGLYELIDGRVTVNQIREVRVEDLLGREPVEVDLASMSSYLSDRVILVTGAGGSIGSELCRQVARFQPRELVLLGRGENSIYEIYQDLAVPEITFKVIPVIADVKDTVELNKIFMKHRPQVVFHAAAHKHVPLMEESPAEAVKNNILGTLNTARAADRCGVEAFIFISSDKAVNPVSIMGATKRVAEMVVQKIGKSSKTRFASVRFGNVLDSRGSVVPLFKKQIARGGPVTVTVPEMTRYFMTIPEAVQLVIQAGALTRGGEVFVLDMGEPMNILALARRMIRLAGFEPGKDIEIIYIGARPGEKLFEEFLTAAEGLKTTPHERIYAAKPDLIHAVPLEKILQTTASGEWTAAKDEVVALLRQVLPCFPAGHIENRERNISSS